MAKLTTLASITLLLGSIAACGDDDIAPSDAGGALDGMLSDVGASDTNTGDTGTSDTGAGDTGMDDTGTDLRRALIEELGSSVWSARHERSEGVDLVERIFEVRFEAASLEWAEIRNPFGPARLRTLRSFSVMPDGRTIDSIILSPAGWPVHPRNGARETWTLEVLPGDPRVLRLTENETGSVEEFAEGPWEAPERGLSAEVRVFGPSGTAWDAFCGAGSTLSDSERRTFWSYARGESATAVLGADVVAGAELGAWQDSDEGENDFGITDVNGFDQNGGTQLSDQFNFVVRYTGTIQHPGGSIQAREEGDAVEDAIWAFIGDDVGSSNSNNLFFEAHGWANGNATDDEVSREFPAGDVPIEVILVRCAMPFVSLFRTGDMQLEMNVANGGWGLVGEQASTPSIDDSLFPPAL